MKLKANRLNKRAEFGEMVAGDEVNPNTGDSIDVFQSSFSRYAGRYSRSFSQQIEVAGTTLEDTSVIVIRHTDKVNDQMKVKFDGDLYNVVSVSSDDSTAVSYDLVTVRKYVVAHG
ncbi:phage head closure protein [Lactiplantibacillus pentosus]|uniref:phage head closure protein n=1 Tax=Lactiplantibacillus pentosus TaxID=1589 RepID=UPI001FD711B5|nr:phage head closure protein [Lactiplantibacillus pentosus]MCJ8184806.1 phage head closure protein [Lactiplantibacillus pentosus]